METNKESKYFSKLLPLENGFKRVVKNAQGIPIDYEYEVGMFLCTKDGIKEGDKVLQPSTYDKSHYKFTILKTPDTFARQYAFAGVNPDINNGNPISLNQHIFKIVGQILSPGIIEGQKFTEKEIEYLTIK